MMSRELPEWKKPNSRARQADRIRKLEAINADLLEACVSMVQRFGASSDQLDQAICNKARAAIARAEEESA